MEFVRRRVGLICKDEGRVKQSFKDQCDINKILKKFKKVVGKDFLSTFNGYQGGQFADVTNVPDLQNAMEIVARAEGNFMTLPAMVRKRFDNDPLVFAAFATDPKNLDEMVNLGLAKKPVPSAAPEAPK